MGLKWNVGTVANIRIWDDFWVPRSVLSRVQSVRSNSVEWVSDLSLADGMGWNSELIDSLFEADEATLIKGIPLPTVPKEDCLVWRGKKNRGFILCEVATSYYFIHLILPVLGMQFLNKFGMSIVHQKLKLLFGNLLAVL